MRHGRVLAPDFAGISLDGGSTAITIQLVNNFHLIDTFDTDLADRGSVSDQANQRILIGRTGVYEVSLDMAASAGGANKEYQTYVYEVAASGSAITGATQADPVVITSASHGFSDGDEVLINSVAGMTELNNRIFKVADKAADTFELTDDGGASPANDIDGSLFAAYTSGGVAYLATRTRVGVRQKYAVGSDVEPGGDRSLVSLTAGNYLMAFVQGVTDDTDLTHYHAALVMKYMG